MNRLEEAIRAVMVSQKIANHSEAATRIGIQKSALSKIILGQVGLSPGNLRKLVLGISDKPEDQFEILRAHLFDEAERSGFAVRDVKIELEGKTPSAINFGDLPIDLQYMLHDLGDEIVRNDDKDLHTALKWLTSAVQTQRSYLAGEKLPDARQHFSPLAAEDAGEHSKPTVVSPIPSSDATALIEAEHKGTEAPAAQSSDSAKRPDIYPTRPRRVKK